MIRDFFHRAAEVAELRDRVITAERDAMTYRHAADNARAMLARSERQLAKSLRQLEARRVAQMGAEASEYAAKVRCDELAEEVDKLRRLIHPSGGGE